MLLDQVNQGLIEAVTAAHQSAAPAVEIEGGGNRDVAVVDEPDMHPGSAAPVRTPGARTESAAAHIAVRSP